MDIETLVRQVVQEVLKGEINTPIRDGGDMNNRMKHGREIMFNHEKEVGVDNPVDADIIAKAQLTTPARIGIGRAGSRMKTRDYLNFRIDHAAAQDAVFMEVSDLFLEQMKLPSLQSKAESREQFLMDVDSGRTLNATSREWAEKNLPKNNQVQIIVADGLSTTGIEANIPDLLPSLLQGLKLKNISVGQPVFVKNSRVWLEDDLAHIVNCDVVITLIGERPGLATSKSISAYMVYRPTKTVVESERTVISNIHDGGLTPVEAGAYLADLIQTILENKASGINLKK